MSTAPRCVLVLALVVASPLLARADSAVELGRRLYRDGIGVDGESVTAVVQGDVPVTGAQIACAGCHKRSGLGASEGGARAPVVTAPALFGSQSDRPANLLRTRAPYDAVSLHAAIVRGQHPDGRTLDGLMPRYRLSDADASALNAYLRTLGSGAAPGIGPDEVDLATIVAADAPARDRDAVTAVVQAFSRYKNGVTRSEPKRAQASRRHLYGERHARAFRKWRVSVWTLNGQPSDWPAQLEALYAQRPPFAVISGAVGDSWSVVDEFCERKELPCLLPVTELPRAVTGGFYTLYYSEGVRLGARVTARSLLQGWNRHDGKILLVHTDDARGRAALDVFVDSWPDSQIADIVAKPIAANAVASARFWHDLVSAERPGVLVAWVSPAQLRALAAASADMPTLPERIYTADSFTDWTRLQAPLDFEQRVLHIYPYSLATPEFAQFPREQAWLKAHELDGFDARVAASALFACHVAGEAMLGMADNYSRDYLVETLEHMLDGTGMTTLFPVTTLGPGQRYLVKGAYVTRLADAASGRRYVSSGWLQPEA